MTTALAFARLVLASLTLVCAVAWGLTGSGAAAISGIAALYGLCLAVDTSREDTGTEGES